MHGQLDGRHCNPPPVGLYLVTATAHPPRMAQKLDQRSDYDRVLGSGRPSTLAP